MPMVSHDPFAHEPAALKDVAGLCVTVETDDFLDVLKINEVFAGERANVDSNHRDEDRIGNPGFSRGNDQALNVRLCDNCDVQWIPHLRSSFGARNRAFERSPADQRNPSAPLLT